MKRIIKFFIKKLLKRKVKFKPHYSELIGALNNEFDSFEDLPQLDNTDNCDNEWLRNRIDIRQNVLNDNPLYFLQWHVIRFTMSTQFPSSFLKKELDELRNEKDYENYWKPALLEKDLGSPERYPYFLRSSGQLIHSSYHLLQLEQSFSLRPDHFSNIFEFGGGYGTLARLSFDLGFVGDYFIYDLPEFSALQKFYLSALNGKDKSLLGNYNFISDISRLPEIEERFNKENNNLFIATWSLSESPVGLRNKFMPIINLCSHILIAFQGDFKEVDNINFFDDFCSQLPSFNFEKIKIKSMDNENYYLLGSSDY
jgi:hypothetical protein